MKKLLVTGAAGFIGSSFVRIALKQAYEIIVLDKLTYAGDLSNLSELLDQKQIHFVQGDIADRALVKKLLTEHQPQALINFAAESHVDNSISGPLPFIETNIRGVFELLEASREYFQTLQESKKQSFRFLQVSTDEVYGELGDTGYFTENSNYSPNSPYSASKASGDLLVRAWHHTYGLPTITTNCSNNYGPRQYPEKLIPLMIQNALSEKPLPVYGTGQNIRDWIYVDDHSRGILLALEKGRVGETYCFGGRSERTNLQVVHCLCEALEKLRPRSQGKYKDLIQFVTDRAGHDFRYAINDDKAQNELGFKREFRQFEEGLLATVEWYLQNSRWLDAIKEKRKKK